MQMQACLQDSAHLGKSRTKNCQMIPLAAYYLHIHTHAQVAPRAGLFLCHAQPACLRTCSAMAAAFYSSFGYCFASCGQTLVMCSAHSTCFWPCVFHWVVGGTEGGGFGRGLDGSTCLYRRHCCCWQQCIVQHCLQPTHVSDYGFASLTACTMRREAAWIPLRIFICVVLPLPYWTLHIPACSTVVCMLLSLALFAGLVLCVLTMMSL
jgi:hypothetical protein